MVIKIVLFNHKGGVSKTTTTFNLGWMLATKGKKVILVDFDPQCNLTGMVLGFKGSNELEALYEKKPGSNIKVGLEPAFESKPTPIEPVECIPVAGVSGLFLLPGHIGVSKYEVVLGVAQTLSGTLQTLQNLPGSISALLEKTAEKYDADYILIDTSPSVSSINQNLLMTCDYFLVPTNPDFFSVMGIDSLAEIFPDWYAWANKISDLDVFKNAVYPFPKPHPKFLGIIIQKYRPRGGTKPAAAFRDWISEIEKTVKTNLSLALEKSYMMLPKDKYTKSGVDDSYTLVKIPDFNSLIAKSQRYQTPVFALTEKQIGLVGMVLERTKKQQAPFKQIFSELADKIIALTSNASRV